MLPNFIGIGAPKAGTTWLFKCLQGHPQIFMAPVKETNFFDYKTIQGRLPEYETHFIGARDKVAVGEISTRYLASPLAPARIKEFIPRVRLFVSLRNPIDEVYSHYWHLQRQNFHQWGIEKIPNTFEEALDQYESQLIGPAFHAKHLHRWLEVFDRSQLHVLLYDDIRSCPQVVLTELYRFLGVNDEVLPDSVNKDDSEVRKGVSPKSQSLNRVYRRIYDLLNRRVYYTAKNVLGVQNAIRLKNQLKVRNRMEQLFFQQGYPPMRAQTRARLRTLFDSDIQATAHLAGRSLVEWN